MQGSDLRALIEKNRFVHSHFSGIYAKGQSFDLIGAESKFIILNTSTGLENSAEQKHWVVIFRHYDTFEFFDALGGNAKQFCNLVPREIRRSLKRLQVNTAAAQLHNSSNCGLFCIYFIYARIFLLERSFNYVLKHIFVIDCRQNETKVIVFEQRLISEGRENDRAVNKATQWHWPICPW
jgi:hypothetical protein